MCTTCPPLHLFRTKAIIRSARSLAAVSALLVLGQFAFANGQTELTTLVSQVRSSVVTVIAFNGDGKPITQGTGFFISTNGTLITNRHVLRGAQKASIKTKTGRLYNIVETIAEDLDGDLVALRADVRGVAVRPLRLSNAPVVPGQRIFVIGSPLGLEETVSEGIVSAVRQLDGVGRVIQITAPISPGSSGSPVINTRGEIVGVASLNLKGGQNLNFAIPSERVAALIRQNNRPSRDPSATGRTRQNKAVTAKKKSANDDSNFDRMFEEMLEDERKSIPGLEQRIAAHPKDVEAYENLGRAYSNNQQLKKAIDVYEKALAFGAESAMIQVSLCDAYSGLEQYDRALSHCDRALILKPSYSYALTTRGRALAGLGRTAQAIEALKEAIKENPEETYAHEQLGFIYMDLGRYEEAAKAFEFMASIASRHAPSFVNLAWAYETLGRNDEAELNYKKAIEIDKQFDDAYIRLAQLYEREDRTADAIMEYKRAIAANPRNADAYLNLGLLYLLTGDRRSTLDTYEKLKKLDPSKARQLSGAIYR